MLKHEIQSSRFVETSPVKPLFGPVEYFAFGCILFGLMFTAACIGFMLGRDSAVKEISRSCAVSRVETTSNGVETVTFSVRPLEADRS